MRANAAALKAMHINEVVGERLDTVFSDAIDPDGAVLDLHFIGDVPQPVLIYAKILGDAIDCGDVMDLIDVGGHAA
ncbi:hypothetical protein AYJ54_37615 [Bradyrhizobium centrolobii]|uniref:Uncharacterized protein n=2 Tax=Bradyrhizobium TaxID=374 RepID=A0A176YMR5_9BRAD|nr:hypothetical protein AXW67_29740 [Bradyrhizobium neotropicale]OAF16845.1 hypothetical protein AYJ54_37615 [Bradyrhizobium centrolobii]